MKSILVFGAVVVVAGCGRGPTYEQALAAYNAQSQALAQLEQRRAAIVAQSDKQLAEAHAPPDRKIADCQRQEAALRVARKKYAEAATVLVAREKQAESETLRKMLRVDDASREALFGAVKKVDQRIELTSEECRLLEEFAGPSYRIAALTQSIALAEKESAAAGERLKPLQAALERAKAEQALEAAHAAEQQQLEREEQASGAELDRLGSQMRAAEWDKMVAEKAIRARLRRDVAPLDEQIQRQRSVVERARALKDSLHKSP